MSDVHEALAEAEEAYRHARYLAAGALEDFVALLGRGVDLTEARERLDLADDHAYRMRRAWMWAICDQREQAQPRVADDPLTAR